MNNILKHANATHATIDLVVKDNFVDLMITDDGVGCDESTQSSGVGIMNIKSRAVICHGTANIITSPGKGYALHVSLPAIYAHKN